MSPYLSINQNNSKILSIDSGIFGSWNWLCICLNVDDYSYIKCSILFYRYIEEKSSIFWMGSFLGTIISFVKKRSSSTHVIKWRWASVLQRARPCASFRHLSSLNDATLVSFADVASAASWALKTVCSSAVCIFMRSVSLVLHSDSLLRVMI